jgi:hypothetical protein
MTPVGYISAYGVRSPAVSHASQAGPVLVLQLHPPSLSRGERDFLCKCMFWRFMSWTCAERDPPHGYVRSYLVHWPLSLLVRGISPIFALPSGASRVCEHGGYLSRSVRPLTNRNRATPAIRVGCIGDACESTLRCIARGLANSSSRRGTTAGRPEGVPPCSE